MKDGKGRACIDMTPEEVAKLLGKSRESVVGLILAGELEAFDLRNPGAKRPLYRITPEALARWRESRRVVPRAAAVDTVVCMPQAKGIFARMRARRREAEMERARREARSRKPSGPAVAGPGGQEKLTARRKQ